MNLEAKFKCGIKTRYVLAQDIKTTRKFYGIVQKAVIGKCDGNTFIPPSTATSAEPLIAPLMVPYLPSSKA